MSNSTSGRPRTQEPRVFANGSEFFAACSSFLCEREAENILIVGIGARLGTAASPHDNFFIASVGAPQIEGVFVMTPPQKLMISAPASEGSIASIVSHFYSQGRLLPGVLGPAVPAQLFAQMWGEKTGARAEVSVELLSYRLSSVLPVPRSSGRARAATAADMEGLVAWSRGFDADAGGNTRDDSLIRSVLQRGISEVEFWVWDNGEAVAMARASGATPSGIRIGSVYTPPEHRGRGYASSLVADVSEMQLRLGKAFCFLFADAANASTNRIYQRIGYQRVGEFREYSFEPS